MTTPEFLLSGSLLFMFGVPVGAATTRRVLRSWERRLTTRGKALEAVRLYLYGLGIELPAWVAHVVDQERQERNARPPRRRWKWWGWWK